MAHEPQETHRKASLSELLEVGDGWAHILVAVLLLLLALAVLANSTYSFAADILHGFQNGNFGHEATTVTFVQRSLNYLADILFGVIILELLSTILTYIHARNLEATIKDFLIVGLISSVRKILLVGAQSSIAGQAVAGEHAEKNPFEFINESIGTVITILGILMLIGGLLWLEKRRKADPAPAKAHE